MTVGRQEKRKGDKHVRCSPHLLPIFGGNLHLALPKDSCVQLCTGVDMDTLCPEAIETGIKWVIN